MNQFDKILNRKNSLATRYNPETLQRLFGQSDILPFWIADMDFKTPDFVLEGIKKNLDFGVLGYENTNNLLWQNLISWVESHHRYRLVKEEILSATSFGSALGIILRTFTDELDGVIIQPPVYMNFRANIRAQHRTVVNNPLKIVEGRYEIDFEDLEKKAADPKNKILLFCNPHNPIGRVWPKKDMQKLGEICLANDVLLVSDEIHGDIVYSPTQFYGMLSLNKEIRSNSITLYSAAKTFNVGGLPDSFLFIPNEKHRDKLSKALKSLSLDFRNSLNNAAFTAAFHLGDTWVTELLGYLEKNIDYIDLFLKDNLPDVSINKPEGTYQLWLDFRKMGIDRKELQRLLVSKGKIALNAGHWFGREGAGFERMNIASPLSIIEDGMQRIARAFE